MVRNFHEDDQYSNGKQLNRDIKRHVVKDVALVCPYILDNHSVLPMKISGSKLGLRGAYIFTLGEY